MFCAEEIDETLAKCSLRLKHVLLLMRYVPADDPYIARNCRVKIARQLEEHGLVDVEPVGMLNWLRCVPTPKGEQALEVLVKRLRVRLGTQSIAEKTGLV